jgi:radical SAM protein with 4Fe4S-binding SPASM domain
VSGVKVSDDQRINDMEKLWGSLVDQVAFVKYNPWENTYSQEINEINTPCSDLWRRMFVWWDGKINPCDVDYKSTLAVGNFFDIGISSAWRSEAYNSLREAHINGKRNNKNPCARCTVI